MWSEFAEKFLEKPEKFQETNNSSVIVALSELNVYQFGRRQDINLVSYSDSIIVVCMWPT